MRRITRMAFGVLATVNGIGDFLSSIVVSSLLLTWFSTSVAFAYSAVLFILGGLLVLRIFKGGIAVQESR